MAKILIVDDEINQLNIMASILKSEGHITEIATNVDSALEIISDFRPNVVLTDLKMERKSGLDLIEKISKDSFRPEVLVITAFGTVDTAVKAMKLGAFNYLVKPIDREVLVVQVQRAAEEYFLKTEEQRLREEIAKNIFDGLIAESKKMKNVLSIANKIAKSDSTILIRGESGTGKERIAKLIHYISDRSKKPLVSINCAAFTETLLESELFGHEKGSFTGADSTHIGLIESATGGTLFLDEVGDMSLSTQAKILRVLQEKQIRRVGGIKNIPVNIRIIAATNKNLEEAIKNKTFREDLFYRLNIIPINIPPLRERKEDIEPLINFFLKRSGKSKKIEKEALDLLIEYPWPGNVRELEAVIERVSILSTDEIIKKEDLPHEIRQINSTNIELNSSFTLPQNGIVFEELEKNLILQALQRSKGVLTDAAKLLGMSYRTFQYRAEKFGLK
jgi:DNA-binding NtrC family response regulator